MSKTVSYQDFSKLKIVVARVLEVTPIEKADRLLKVKLDAGEEYGQRTVIAGIKKWYEPEELIGRQVVYFANLEPRELYGVVSQGMILAADDKGACLLQPDKEVTNGSKVL